MSIVRSCSALLTAFALAGAANAQTYPNGQVRLIVPTSPGGVTDTMARIVAQRLTETLNQTVIVENRPGGNSLVGAQAVARAPADGLTLLVTSDATITANPSLIGNWPTRRRTSRRSSCCAAARRCWW